MPSIAHRTASDQRKCKVGGLYLLWRCQICARYLGRVSSIKNRSTTNTRRSLTAQIGDLMRCKPAHAAPEHVKTTWIADNLALLAAIEAAQATR